MEQVLQSCNPIIPLLGKNPKSAAPAIMADIDLFWQERFENPSPFTEREVKQLLASFGICTTREGLARTSAEAVQLAESIGYPVAMKIESPDIIHKSDMGGVVLSVDSKEVVVHAFEKIIANAQLHKPNADIHGVLIQEMVGDHVEAFVGIARHDPFGFGIVVGPGGVLVELIDDTAFDLLPVDAEGVQNLIDRTALKKLLVGFRGSAAADRQALIETILKLTEIVHIYGSYLETIELNPISVSSKGTGIVVLDAVIIHRAH